MAKVLRKHKKCEMPNCPELATELVYDRKNKRVLAVCTIHIRLIETDRPEYSVDCPNCSCKFGVN